MKSSQSLLYIDDHKGASDYVMAGLESLGYQVWASGSWKDGKKLIARNRVQPDVILLDPVSQNSDSISIEEVCGEGGAPVVILSSSRDPQRLADFLKQGAHEFLCKPFQLDELRKVLEGALLSEAKVSRTESSGKSGVEFVCHSRTMEVVKRTALQVARSTVPVLITGETGVGKDVIARLIHENSPLADLPFVKVNCAAMPTDLVESELFGYRKGAFTGAYIDRPGKFEFANNGSIFLDEIAELTPAVQAKLLQVLQDGRFSRLGGNEEVQVEVRVIAATNQRLEAAIKEGSFREDLYYRLNVVNINISPLRHRREEIPFFAQFFLEKFIQQYRADVTELPAELLEVFNSYDWPGNVRELENLVKRYAVLQDADSIRQELLSKISERTAEDLDQLTDSYLEEAGDSEIDLKEITKRAVCQVEKSMIARTLEQTGWNKSKAARELKVSYKTLLTKIDQYGLGRR